MNAIRVVIEHRDGVIEYITHVVNRSKHALTGAVRNAWRKYPAAKAVNAQFTEHDCASCQRTHAVTPLRRVYHRKPKRGAA